MKIKELRDLSGEDLTAKGKELSEALFRSKFQNGIRPLENPAKIRQLRKAIARVNTLISAKRKAEAAS